ncbi:MAG: LysR substrate-binding domain-containing protein [Pseudomonadota bacterium]|nr:LysR substrate-binding domain-containing protein [Pseudomonadota bacterium]
MNLRDLKYLVAVAEHRHFGRAAEACHVSQPTLSTQIRKLEEFLGVTLIERNNRQVLLTPLGERIIAQAQRVLHDADELVKLAQQARDPYGGQFRLGIIPTVAPYLLPRILPLVRAQFPELEIQLVEAQTAVISRELRAGRLDAIILALPVEDDGVVAVPLYAEPFYVAVSPDHAFAARAAVPAVELEDAEVLLLEDGHCLRDQALDVCKSSGAVENTNFSATSIETLRHMVSANVGITLMPELAIDAPTVGVRYVPFEGVPPHRIVGMVWRTTTTREALLGRLEAALEGVVETSLSLADVENLHGTAR